MDKHLSDEQLNAFVDGELDAEERSRVFSESEHSAELDQRLCQQRKVKELVTHAYVGVPPPKRVRESHRMPDSLFGRAMMASALLLLGAAVGLFAQRFVSPAAKTDVLSVAAISAPVASGHNYILHVISGEREPMLAALQKARFLLDSAQPGEFNQVEVVANQKGLNLLRSDITPFAHEIQELQDSHVVFYACSRTIEQLEEKGVDVHLLPETKQAYTALDRVVIRMKDSWEYIRI